MFLLQNQGDWNELEWKVGTKNEKYPENVRVKWTFLQKIILNSTILSWFLI